MLLRLSLALCALVVLPASASHAELDHGGGSYSYICSFNRNSRQVTCGGITCTAIEPGLFAGDLLPAGTYRIGPLNTEKSVTWYNLYPLSGGSYWDHYSGVPGLSCKSGFALHGGSLSKGCITVTSDYCMNQIASYLNQRYAWSFNARECRACTGPNCFWGSCRCGEDVVGRKYIGLLRAYD